MTDDQAALPLQFSEHALWSILEQVQREVAGLKPRIAEIETRLTDLEDDLGDDDYYDDQGRTTYHPRCIDCDIELMPQTPPGAKDWQRFIVHDEVWQAAGLDRGWICVDCLETRLGRPLTGTDFPAHLPINNVDPEDTERLAELKREAAQMARSGAT